MDASATIPLDWSSASRSPKQARFPQLTVIVPVYNEAATIEQVVERIVQEPTDKEVLLVDDGSTDGTLERIHNILLRFDGAELPAHVVAINLLTHPKNCGKGAAIRTGLRAATGEFVVIQDADLEVSPEEYPDLLKPLLAGEAEFVIGSRQTVGPQRRWLYGFGIGLLNCLVRSLYGVRVADEACCFKVLRTADLRAMELDCRRFEFCPEVIAKASRMGLRFCEVPVQYSPRTAADGKKLRLRDGLVAIATLWRYRGWSRKTSAS